MEIRKTIIKNLTKEGIPQDSKDVMDYFNKSLKENPIPWIPRKNPITIEEIKNLWMPSMERNITFLAEDLGKIMGSLTIFYDLKSTGYKHKLKRKPGALNLTIDPNYNYFEISLMLIKRAIKELKKMGKTAYVKGAKESPVKEIMETLGYKLRKSTSKVHKNNNLSGDVYGCIIP